MSSKGARKETLIAFGILAVLLLAGCVSYWSLRHGWSLDRLRQDPAIQLRYPNAENLLHGEKGTTYSIDDGVYSPPSIADFYGTEGTSAEVEAFYGTELQNLGWLLEKVESNPFYGCPRRLVFSKADLILRLEFREREELRIDLPDADWKGYPVIFKIDLSYD